MFKILQELTVWGTEYRVPNHTYLLDDSGNILAYAIDGTDEIRKSSGQIKIDRRGRKFVEVKHAALLKLAPKQSSKPVEKKVSVGVRVFKVDSKGKTYFVEKNQHFYNCNCIGFGYRRKCKHVDAVKNMLDKSIKV